MEELLEELWRAACTILYHDASSDDEEYQFNKRALIKKWRIILREWEGEQSESLDLLDKRRYV